MRKKTKERKKEGRLPLELLVLEPGRRRNRLTLQLNSNANTNSTADWCFVRKIPTPQSRFDSRLVTRRRFIPSSLPLFLIERSYILTFPPAILNRNCLSIFFPMRSIRRLGKERNASNGVPSRIEWTLRRSSIQSVCMSVQSKKEGGRKEWIFSLLRDENQI